LQVRNLMKSPVVSIGPDATLSGAARLMVEHEIGSVLVEDEGRTAGILTERDVMRAAAKLGDLTRARVSDHLTSPVVTASPGWDVAVAAAEMVKRRIRHLVVQEAARPLGVISMRDVMSVFLPERVHQQES
jgi:signal-transduction protein with cAMP-binding, CBS, and nucleotidyltransferase domain